MAGFWKARSEMKQIMMYAGEGFEIMVDCRSGTPFDLVALPTGEPVMRCRLSMRPTPGHHRPDGAEAAGKLPTALVKLPPIPATLPPISQELVMNMFRDKEGMAPLTQAGLAMVMGSGTGMSMGGKIDPAVLARVVKLIKDQPEMPRAQQLSAMDVNGKPFSITEKGFAVQRGQDLRWRISEGNDQMLHPVHIHGCQFRIVSQSGQKPESYRAGWKYIADLERRLQRDPW